MTEPDRLSSRACPEVDSLRDRKPFDPSTILRLSNLRMALSRRLPHCHTLQGYLVQKKPPPTRDHHRALNIALL